MNIGGIKMTSFVENATWGTIAYTESFWSGKKQLFINGKPLQKIDKKTFSFHQDGKNYTFIIKGSFVTGVKLLVDGQEITIISPAKWYEYVCSIFIFALTMVWGNSVTLCSIFPIIGGAIGGGLSAIMALANLIAMRSVNKIWLKLVIFVGVLIATMVLMFIFALMFVSILI